MPIPFTIVLGVAGADETVAAEVQARRVDADVQGREVRAEVQAREVEA